MKNVLYHVHQKAGYATLMFKGNVHDYTHYYTTVLFCMHFTDLRMCVNEVFCTLITSRDHTAVFFAHNWLHQVTQYF